MALGWALLKLPFEIIILHNPTTAADFAEGDSAFLIKPVPFLPPNHSPIPLVIDSEVSLILEKKKCGQQGQSEIEC